MTDNNSKPIKLASLGVRLGALVCEILFLIIFMVGLGRLFFTLALDVLVDDWVPLLFALEFVCGFIYYGFCWVKKRQTIVMKVWQIQILSLDGTSVGWKCAVIRYICLCFLGFISLVPIGVILFTGMKESKLFFILLGTFPYWWAILDRERLFLHDRLSGARFFKFTSSEEV